VPACSVSHTVPVHRDRWEPGQPVSRVGTYVSILALVAILGYDTTTINLDFVATWRQS
jgi:hypothetical protein